MDYLYSLVLMYTNMDITYVDVIKIILLLNIKCNKGINLNSFLNKINKNDTNEFKLYSLFVKKYMENEYNNAIKIFTTFCEFFNSSKNYRNLDKYIMDDINKNIIDILLNDIDTPNVSLEEKIIEGKHIIITFCKKYVAIVSKKKENHTKINISNIKENI